MEFLPEINKSEELISEKESELIKDEMKEPKTDFRTNPDYAEIVSFLNNFAILVGTKQFDFKNFERMLSSKQFDPQLVDLHLRLIRHIQFGYRKPFLPASRNILKAFLTKFCNCFVELEQIAVVLSKEGWEGLTAPQRMLLLQTLCNAQFEYNPTFKKALKKSFNAREIRLTPIGKDKRGNEFFYQQDDQLNFYIWQNSVNTNEWTLRAEKVSEFRDFLLELMGNSDSNDDEKRILMSKEEREKVLMESQFQIHWDLPKQEYHLNKLITENDWGEEEEAIVKKSTPKRQAKEKKAFAPLTINDLEESENESEEQFSDESSDESDVFSPSFAESSSKGRPTKKKGQKIGYKKKKTKKSSAPEKITLEKAVFSDEEESEEDEKQEKNDGLIEGEESPLTLSKLFKQSYRKTTLNEIMATSCTACKSNDDEELILLCDHCDDGWHIYCTSPQLPVVPEGEWNCPLCEHSFLVIRLTFAYLSLTEAIERRELQLQVELRAQRRAEMEAQKSAAIKRRFLEHNYPTSPSPSENRGRKKQKKSRKSNKSSASDTSSLSRSSSFSNKSVHVPTTTPAPFQQQSTSHQSLDTSSSSSTVPLMSSMDPFMYRNNMNFQALMARRQVSNNKRKQPPQQIFDAIRQALKISPVKRSPPLPAIKLNKVADKVG